MKKLLLSAFAIIALSGFMTTPAFADKGGTANASSGNSGGGSQNANPGFGGGNSPTNDNDISGKAGN